MDIIEACCVVHKLSIPYLVYGSMLVPYLPTAKKKQVWDYFGFEADCNKKIISKEAVYCKLCTQPSIWIPYSSNTSNLTYHLSKHHLDIYAKVCGASKVGKQNKEKRLNQETIHEAVTKTTPYTKDSNRMKQLVCATGNFIVQSLQPISTVDEP